ncbi:FAD-dependent monooxygenase [Aeromicrobium wangtongii]|uniref:FAD-dependent monooxygenase n=1 Tax=Aeromicrobium wangtongii TaxID=2969247 RepID=A0ABY5MAW4_9ACTN|nr:FAD-dependent monooxygenase [Aeromicrobium wangtongii]MCD9199058.1 FAD-dependent monooxygenase [Aeromicrobium wangtongii]UUP12911.1 FAD-dependent monooxygenase [Aeromicrobium wangtongii]
MSVRQDVPPVAISGAGPVGMALAIDLALRGIPSVLFEKRSEEERIVARANMTNVRSMEHFRRWGIADALRDNDPVSTEVQRDVAFVTRLSGHEILRFPRAYEWSERLPIASEVAEWAPNEAIEKTLRDRVRSLPIIDLRFDSEVLSFEQDDQGVTVTVDGPNGEESHTAQYLVVAEGSRSKLRREGLNVRMEGHPNLARSFLWHIYAPGLAELWKATEMSSMLLFYNEDRAGDSLVPQSGTDHWAYFASPVPDGVDGDDWEACRAMLFRAIGEEFEVEPLAGGTFITHSIQAPRYDFGRVLLIGDSAHMVSPMGGFGMNIGIGDAADLGWKLAAVLDGWGGPALIPSYSIERGEAARFILKGCESNQAVGPRELVRDGIEEDGPIGDAVRAQVAEDIKIQKARQFKRMGGQLGYRYSSSPVIFRDGTDQPAPSFEDYVPSSAPGNRAPHHWLKDGSSLYDHLGNGFTLLVLGDLDAGELVRLAESRGVPLQVLTVEEPDLAELTMLYETGAALIRSDHHVAWRGDALPDDLDRLLDVITGSVSWA